MSLIKYTSPSKAARLWAVLALLFVLGAQVQEIAHYHASGEPVSSCVQCHSTAGAAIAASLPGIPLIAAAAALLLLLRSPAKSTSVREAFRPRGPPGKS